MSRINGYTCCARVLTITLIAILPLIRCAPRWTQNTDVSALGDALSTLAAGRGDLSPLTLTYDDVHALHGGLRLTIHGNGTVEQQALRMKVGEPKERVARDDLTRLVALLVKHEVWIQRVPERQLVPDESRAVLKTCYGGNCVEIWEWYNQLEETGRISDVLALMKEIAWKPSAHAERVQQPAQKPDGPTPTTGKGSPPQSDPNKKNWFVREEVSGGWRIALPLAGRHHQQSDAFVSAVSHTERVLLVAAAASTDHSRLEMSAATLVNRDGTLLMSLPLSGHTPVDADVAPNGRRFAVITQNPTDPNEQLALRIFDDTGARLGSRAASPDRALLVGNDWIALWTSPLAAAYAEEDDAPPVSPDTEPVEFIRLDGTPMPTQDVVRGALAKMGNGLAAVADGQLSIYDASLTELGRAALGFPIGVPYAAADGSLIAVAEYTTGRDKRIKRLALFDAAAKRLGALTLKAALGIEAAVAADGTAVLATPASLGTDGPAPVVEDSPTIDVLLADRAGQIRWTRTVDRRAADEYVAHLTVSSAGRRAAVALKADGLVDRMMVFDEKGEVLHVSELEDTTGLWLDPAGESIFLAEGLSFSCLKIDILQKGPSRAIARAPAIDTTTYVLVTTQNGFLLQERSDPRGRPLTIPRGWLVPSDDEEAEQGNYVSSFNYRETVTSFDIGDGRQGIQISSYDIQRDGSAQASAGRDVFLVLDPRSRRLHKPDLRLGLTRHKVRSRGCVEASQSNFLLSDINNDGLLDLGVIRTELECREVEKNGVDTVEGPFAAERPVRWHVFARDGWRHDAGLDGKSPSGPSEQLPLAATPVDDLKATLKQRR